MHLEALTEPRQVVFHQLTKFAGYYLAGGTAIALQLGHRRSVDFDLFGDSPIKMGLLRQVEEQFAPETVAPLVNNADELTATVAGTKLSFIHYQFPVLQEFVDLAGVPTLTVQELAATKAYTIGRRGSLKDYVDLYTIVSGGHSSLENIIKLASQKYSDVFNGRLFLEQLVWLEDVEEEPITFLGPTVTKEEIRQVFSEALQAANLLNRH